MSEVKHNREYGLRSEVELSRGRTAELARMRGDDSHSLRLCHRDAWLILPYLDGDDLRAIGDAIAAHLREDAAAPVAEAVS